MNEPKTPSPSRFRGILAIVPLALAALAACGGGGGGTPAVGGGNGGGIGGGNGGNGGNAGAGGGATPAYSRLWVPHYNQGQLRAWSKATLAKDVDGTPDVTITLPAGTKPNALAFDAAGALWVTDNANSRLLKYGRGQIGASGAPVPLVVIDSDQTSLKSPIGLAFDRADNLWVAVAGRLEMFVPTNLDDSGPTTPNRVLDSATMALPAEVSFDAAGNLWMTNASFTVANNSVYVFTPEQLAAGGRQVPRLTLTSAAFALVEGMRMDSRGDLWVASNDGLNVARFAASSLVVPAVAETRKLVPVASLEADNDDGQNGRSVRKPGGIVFDRDGNLFVNSQRGGDGSAVLEFRAQQLVGLAGPKILPATVLVARSTSNPGFGGLVLELP